MLLFENSLAAEIRLLQSQTVMNSYFHFFIIVESAACQVLLERPKKMTVLWGKTKTVGWMLQKFPVKQ
jgi:hypothetical protein